MENKPKFRPNQNLRLMDQVREGLRYHHYAYRTEQTYCQWILRYIQYFGGKTHPLLLGAKLAASGNVSEDGYQRSHEPQRPVAAVVNACDAKRHDQYMVEESGFGVCQGIVVQHSLPGYGPELSVNRPVRTRMPGGVGAGGWGRKTPATRLAGPSCVARRKIHGYAASLARWMAPLNRERGSKHSQRHIPPAGRPGGQCSRPLLYFCSSVGSITAGTTAPGGQGVQPPAPQHGAASRHPFWSFGKPLCEPRSRQSRRIDARDCIAGGSTGSCQSCRAPRQGSHATGTGCDQRLVQSRPDPRRCRAAARFQARNPPTGPVSW